MIRLVVALRSEARPLVRALGLERVGRGRPAIWLRGETALIVSGIGRAAAARAVRRLAAERSAPGAAWLNVGIGGHRSLPLGELVLAREVVDADTGERHRLRPPAAPGCAHATVTTVGRPELGYPEDTVYDMEAAALCAAVAAVSPRSPIQVAKVISDNRAAPPERLTARRVEALIESRLECLARLVEQLAGPAAQ